MKKTSILRKMLDKNKIIVAPGVYDCISAKIAQKLDFSVISITGHGLEASALGNPDIGLATKTDVVCHARFIARSVEIPVICDADTGYGNVLNVWEMVREFEHAGISGIHIEDQTFPKRCGGMSGRKLISSEEMQGKIEAAINARTDKAFVVIARSDARGIEGVDEAINRFNAYFDAGADMAFAGEHYEKEELEKVAKSIKGPLCICGGIPGWNESLLPLDEYERMGIQMILFPLCALYSSTKAIFDVYRKLKSDKGILPSTVASQMVGFDEFVELMNMQYWTEIEAKYMHSCKV